MIRITNEQIVGDIMQDVVDLETGPTDCGRDHEDGLCVNRDTLEIILRRHILDEDD